MDTLKDKIMLITGGSSGIGRATALVSAREGAKVVIAARGVERGMEVVREIKATGGEALFVATRPTRWCHCQYFLLEWVWWRRTFFTLCGNEGRCIQLDQVGRLGVCEAGNPGKCVSRGSILDPHARISNGILCEP